MIIGIEGKIGSGKSSACEYIKENYDFEYISCDDIVDNLYTEKNILEKISSLLSTNINSKQDVINYIGDDFDLSKKINDLFDELVNKKIKEYIEKEKNHVIENYDLRRIDINFDIVFICYVKDEVLIDRVIKRDKITKEKVINILKNQKNIYMNKSKIYTIDSSNYKNYAILDKVIKGYYESKNW